jgi:Protein of unknown function (DUF2442)
MPPCVFWFPFFRKPSQKEGRRKARLPLLGDETGSDNLTKTRLQLLGMTVELHARAWYPCLPYLQMVPTVLCTLVLETEPAAVQVTVTNEKLMVELADGRIIVVPLEWYPRLMYGTPEERLNWQLLGDGYAIEWPDLDEHIGIEGLLAGRRSGESQKSLERWLVSRMSSNTKVDQQQVSV